MCLTKKNTKAGYRYACLGVQPTRVVSAIKHCEFNGWQFEPKLK